MKRKNFCKHTLLSTFEKLFETKLIKCNNLLRRIRKMASFELGKEIVKDFFSSCRERGPKQNILNPHEESNFRPSDYAL